MAQSRSIDALSIDTAQSFGWFERQWGVFGLSGYYAFWLYLSNGLMIHSWILAPTLEMGYGEPAFATVWHPDGLHEVVAVDPSTRAWDIWTSNFSGKKYFNKFLFDLEAHNTSLYVTQTIGESELTPRQGGYNISEAYCQGEGKWDGKEVTFFGHVEQLSAL